MNNRLLDSYSLLIVTKYFENSQDYINLICVNSKFKETTEKLRFNPIPIASLKLLSKIQTQYLYSDNDTKIKGIDNYEILYNVNYDQYLKFKEDNIKYHKVFYTRENRLQYGNVIPKKVNIFGKNCFGISCPYANDASNIKEIDISSKVITLEDGCFYGCSSLSTINLPISLTSIGNYCFSYCSTLSSINLPSSLTSLSNYCFEGCYSLSSIELPSSLTSLGNQCFEGCSSLSTINLPLSLTSLGNNCFQWCSTLSSINLPSSLTSLGEGCFRGCSTLSSIDLPSPLKSLSYACFQYCKSLKSVNLPTTITSLGNYCFYGCSILETINGVKNLKIGEQCFEECNKLRNKPTNSSCVIS